MALSLGFIMALIGASIGLLVGILIFSEVSEAIDCDSITVNNTREMCQNATGTAFIVISILPIALFFTLFMIFGGIRGSTTTEVESDNTRYSKRQLRKLSLKERSKLLKEKQKKADEERFKHNDLVVHSFVSNWLRGKKKN